MSRIYSGNVGRLGDRSHERTVIGRSNVDMAGRSYRELSCIDETRHHSADSGDVENILDQKLERTIQLLLVTASFGQSKEKLLQEINTLSIHAGCLQQRSQGMKFSDTRLDILLVPDSKWLLSNIRSTKQLYHLLFRTLVGVLRATINLCKDNNDGDTETAAKIQVVLRHMGRWMATVDKNECIVRHTSRHSVDRCLEVLLVTGKIHERNDSVGLASNLILCFALVGTNSVLSSNGLASTAKSH
mmetsp:Transcript_5384/g.8816  ORF Transcript_5384/g.8816 Transcript_5384/m.8816 type:complete len:244 (+) Transcript_5384:555-1286(+)